MPNIKSATKRMELSRAANARNRARRSAIRTAMRRVREAENAEQAEARYRHAVSLLDSAARTRLFHPNQTARLKSRLAKAIKAAHG
jgi:small subunit ribosomal protein S20